MGRSVPVALVSGLLGMTCAPALAAQKEPAGRDFPVRPVRIIVPQPPGASTDLTARLIAQKLAEAFRQPVIVDNRPGAGTTTGTDIVVKSAPDGYTLLVVASSITINPSLYKNLSYDPVRDLEAVTQLSAFPNMLTAHPAIPVKTTKDLIALAKAKPGALNVGSSGTGTGSHLSGELFKYMTGTQWVHVPYKGGGPGITALLGGEVQLYFATIVSVLPHIRANRLRGIAVTTAKRSPAAPDTPTIAESGVPGYDHGPWNGMFAPAKTPKALLARISGQVAKIVHSPDAKNVLNTEGADPVGNAPEEFSAIVKSEIAKWAKVIKAAGIKVD
jgi:tripartite-type tricarboxylate transporter receptor subunit TctC